MDLEYSHVSVHLSLDDFTGDLLDLVCGTEHPSLPFVRGSNIYHYNPFIGVFDIAMKTANIPEALSGYKTTRNKFIEPVIDGVIGDLGERGFTQLENFKKLASKNDLVSSQLVFMPYRDSWAVDGSMMDDGEVFEAASKLSPFWDSGLPANVLNPGLKGAAYACRDIKHVDGRWLLTAPNLPQAIGKTSAVYSSAESLLNLF